MATAARALDRACADRRERHELSRRGLPVAGAVAGRRARAAFTAIIQKHGVGADLLLRVPPVVDGGITYDQEDRILAGAKLLQDLIAGQHSTAPI